MSNDKDKDKKNVCPCWGPDEEPPCNSCEFLNQCGGCMIHAKEEIMVKKG
jgi:radical SAM protein with 4Fe4S-binding SPASM domain